MFEPAGDLGLQQEPPTAVGVVGSFGLDLLQRHLALKLGVEGHRDLADASLGVGAQELEPRPVGRGCTQVTIRSRRRAISWSRGQTQVVGIERLIVTRVGRRARDPKILSSKSVSAIVVLGDRRHRGILTNTRGAAISLGNIPRQSRSPWLRGREKTG